MFERPALQAKMLPPSVFNRLGKPGGELQEGVDFLQARLKLRLKNRDNAI